jgi:hypothetical protein
MENDMDKKLIQQLLDDDETRAALADKLLLRLPDERNVNYHYHIREALEDLNDTLVEGDMVTIEVSDHMWVRGEYVRTEPDGKVEVLGRQRLRYTGKRVDLVIKDHEGETI